MKKFLIIGLLGFAAMPQSFAQSTDPLFDMRVHPPEAASLGEYVERPVSYYTGTPQISIPIHTIKLKDFSFPISLSYHASGVKVDEVASNVGMGWTLIAGGSIIKIAGNGSGALGPAAVHYPDDYCNFSPNVSVGNESDPDYQYALSVTENNLKTEADLFNYNFLGNTGKFIRDPLSPDDYYAIPLNNLKISYSNGKFIIIDEKGINYEFEVVEVTSHADYPTASSSINGFRPSSSYSFHLTKVSLPSGEHIVLEYESNHYAYVSSLSEEEYQPSGSNIGCSVPTHFNFPVKSVSLVGGQRIKKISAYGPKSGTSPFMHVDFNYDQSSLRQDITLPDDYPGAFTNEARKLESIKVYYLNSISSNPVHTFNLNQDYTTSTGLGGDSYEDSLKERLWLTSVEEEGKSAYRFEYNHDNPLPKRLSFGQDYYGYYNGISNNPSMIPNTVASTAKGANRNVNYTYAQSGILRKIIYPTGGYTTFDYEGNEGGAGVRLLSQKSYGHDNVMERDLYYEYEQVSNIHQPIFHQTVNIPDGNYSTCTWQRNTSGAIPSFTGRYRSFTIGYGKVTEKNGPNGEQGQTVYEFHQNIGGITSGITYTGASISYEWAQGLPKKTTYYANYNGDPVKVKELIYNYEVTNGLATLCDASENTNLQQFDIYLIKVSRPAQSTAGVVNSLPAEFEYEQLKIITNWQYQSSVEEIDYPSDLSLTTPTTTPPTLSKTTEYVYDADKKVLLSSKMTGSQGQVHETRYKHPYFYLAAAGLGVYKKMADAYIINNPIETQVWVDDQLVESAITTYEDINGNYVPKHAYRAKFADPIIPSGHESTIVDVWDNTLFDKRATFVHDNYGRIVQQSKEGDVITSYVWGYDKTLVVAVVQNVDQATVESTIAQYGPVDLNQNLNPNQVNELRNLAGARVTHYEYDPGKGVTKITDPNQQTTRFIYDGNGRLIRVLDNNSNVLQQYEYRYKSQN